VGTIPKSNINTEKEAKSKVLAHKYMIAHFLGLVQHLNNGG
jgi:hypothetical protein